MKMSPIIFREYDIRGIVGEHFDEEFANTLGKAYASFLYRKTGSSSPTITIGHDARFSSENLVSALSQGLRDSGVHVRLLGLVTSPMSYFSTFYYKNINGNIMVTGSHNPPAYNGFKISLGNSTIYGEDIQTLYKIIKDKDFRSGSGSIEKMDVFADYLEHYKKEFGDLSGINVVLDCGNGAAGVIARKLYEACGLKPEILFEKPDGAFPNHHPDPTVEKNLKDLKSAVTNHKAHLGIGFDGDADRIGVVDNTGRMVLGDELMVLIGRSILKENRGAKIIGDVKCSNRLFNDIRKNGGSPIMWKTGHSLIKQKIKEEGAPFGGELSGHIFFNDRNFGYDDAPYAGLRVVEILKKANLSFSSLVGDLPKAYYTPEIRIDTTEEKKLKIVNTIKKEFLNTPGAEIHTLDGIRVNFKDGWFLARASNTQPVVVLRFEGATSNRLQELQDKVEGIVNPLL